MSDIQFIYVDEEYVLEAISFTHKENIETASHKIQWEIKSEKGAAETIGKGNSIRYKLDKKYSGEKITIRAYMQKNSLKDYPLQQIFCQVDGEKETKKEISGLLIKEVQGSESAQVGDTIECEVTKYSVASNDIPGSQKDKIKWDVQIESEAKKVLTIPEGKALRGEKISFVVPESWKGKSIILMPYMRTSTTSTSTKIDIGAGGSIEIKPLSTFELGSLNDNSENTQEGMIYSAKYKFEAVFKIPKEEPVNKSDIIWEFSYYNPKEEKTEVKEMFGKQVDFKLDDVNMLGQEMKISVGVKNNQNKSSINLWVHYRFRWIDRATLVSEIMKRKMNPEIIDQGASSLCAMASIGYLLAKLDKVQYSNFIYDMHQYGKSTIESTKYLIKLDDDEHLVEYKNTDSEWPEESASKAKMTGADFIFLLSIRDHFNLVFDYDPDNDSAGGFIEGIIGGLTLPIEVDKMMKKIMNFSSVKNDTNALTSKWGWTTNLIDDIKKQLEDDFHVILLVNASSLINADKAFFSYPSHWVVVEEIDYNEKDEQVTFKIFTWGKYKTVTTSFGLFKDGYYGYVKGKEK